MIIAKFFSNPSKFLPYIFVFIASFYLPWDSDLGWHLKYGEYFFQHGAILRENIFSSEMTSFLWPNTSWGIDLIYYAAFSTLGFFGLTLLGAIIITLTFYFFAKAFDLDFWNEALIFPFIVYLEHEVNVISFRGQVLSVMFLGLLFYVLSKFDKNGNRRIFYWLMPLFLFWANLHGQFILGMGIFLLWVFFYFVRRFWEKTNQPFSNFFLKVLDYIKKDFKEIRFLFLIVLGCLFSTFIHPFGVGIYIDAFLHFQNPVLLYINEYIPFDELSDSWWNLMVFGILTMLGALFLFFQGKIKRSLPYLGTAIIIYFLSFFVKRYVWSAYYLGIPFLAAMAEFVKPQTKSIAKKSATIILVLGIVIALIFKFPHAQFFKMSWSRYCADFNECNTGAFEFLKEHKFPGKLLSLYGWGGYLIWNYPEIKPSVDGRMHLWRDENGYSAFEEYYAYEQNWKDIDDSKYDVVLMSPNKAIYGRLEELVEQGKWQKVFEDNVGGVFVRNGEASKSSEFLLK